jgi:hypothetical protein
MPSSLYGHQSFSGRLRSLRPAAQDADVFLDLAPARFVRADGIAHLIAMIFTLLRRGYRITVSRPENEDANGYLQRTDFWGLLNRAGITAPEEWAGFNQGNAVGLVECQEIRTQGDLIENLDRNELLGDQLRAAFEHTGLNRTLYRLFVELGNNAAEHSHSEHGAFVMAQVYRSAGGMGREIELSVVDVGRGIRAALFAAHGFTTDRAAVRAALEDGITGRLDAAGRPTGTGGFGLATARHEATRLIVRSGAVVFESVPMEQTDAGPAPRRENKLLVMRWQDCPPLDGTIVTAIIRSPG